MINAEQCAKIVEWKDNPVQFFKDCIKVYSPYEEDVVSYKITDENTLAIQQIHKDGTISFGADRQKGVSTLLMAYALHYALFNGDRTITICGRNYDSSNRLAIMFREMLRNLPDFMQPKLIVNNKKHIQFENGCRILVTTPNESNYRGYTISLAIFDDFEFITNSRSLMMCVMPAIACKSSKIIAASTGSSPFAEMYLPSEWTRVTL